MNSTNPLENFYRNSFEREAVKQFMVDSLKELAVERTFNSKDVKGIQECRELVDKIFDKLDDIYGTIKEPIIPNSK